MNLVTGVKLLEFGRRFYDRLYSFFIKKGLSCFSKSCIISSDATIKGGKYVKIGDYTVFARHSVITAWDRYLNQRFDPQISIGTNCSFGEFCHISAISEVIIGNHVLTGRRVTITDNSHGLFSKDELDVPPLMRPLYSKGIISIGDNVWIGENVVIMANVQIGKGTIIGAGSIVTHDIPPYSLAVGNPAKVIKTFIHDNF